ncbi:MAG: hypothetical protein FWE09_04575, partial [Treponema sp.]|nr:hypothetical protein [Treponema sp.]
EAMATLLGKFWGLDITAREVFLDMTSGLPQDAQGARAFPHDRGVAHGGAEGSMNGSATDIALPQTRKLAQSRNPRAPSFPKAFS